MKPGDKITCILPGRHALTKGKTYLLIDRSKLFKQFITIENDLGKKVNLGDFRFAPYVEQPHAKNGEIYFPGNEPA